MWASRSVLASLPAGAERSKCEHKELLYAHRQSYVSPVVIAIDFFRLNLKNSLLGWMVRMMSSDLLGFDLGAESGRLVCGRLDDRRLTFEEVFRFVVEPMFVSGMLYWDVLGLYRRMLESVQHYFQKVRTMPSGIGIASWSNDFGLLAPDGQLLGNPVHYRDARTRGTLEVLQQRIAANTIHRTSGMALASTQTVCQLLAMRIHDDVRLDCARTFLMIPDLLAYFLTGEHTCERTNAVNTQLYNAHTGTWWTEMLDILGLAPSLMPPLVSPGTEIGPVTGEACAESGLKGVPVFASCTHDTASAVAAVPGIGKDWAFISSGTWSVVGTMVPRMLPEACELGLCNELTLEGTFLCRNIMGLWLLQRARRAFASAGQNLSYSDLVALALNEPGGTAVLHVDDPIFFAPGNMLDAIRQFCRKHRQVSPETPGAVTRCILESLALSYRHALDQIQRMTGKRFEALHIVGGGSKNSLLSQMTADACRTVVVAGPTEATAIGNLLTVAVGRGLLANAAEVRDVVRSSSNLVTYTPFITTRWDELYQRYLAIVGYL